jgi:sialic acid synthase SpsE
MQEAEKKSIKFKRSLFVVQDIKAGEIFTTENLQSKRPAFGLHTRYYDVILGQKAKQDISSGTPLIWDMIE